MADGAEPKKVCFSRRYLYPRHYEILVCTCLNTASEGAKGGRDGRGCGWATVLSHEVGARGVQHRRPSRMPRSDQLLVSSWSSSGKDEYGQVFTCSCPRCNVASRSGWCTEAKAAWFHVRRDGVRNYQVRSVVNMIIEAFDTPHLALKLELGTRRETL